MNQVKPISNRERQKSSQNEAKNQYPSKKEDRAWKAIKLSVSIAILIITFLMYWQNQ